MALRYVVFFDHKNIYTKSASLTPHGGLRIVARLLVSLTLCHFSTLKTFLLLLLLGTPPVSGGFRRFYSNCLYSSNNMATSIGYAW